MVQPDQVKAAIHRALPDAAVEIEDLTGGGDHLQVRVVSSAFAGLNRIRQHQLVYGALRQELASEAIHALARPVKWNQGGKPRRGYSNSAGCWQIWASWE